MKTILVHVAAVLEDEDQRTADDVTRELFPQLDYVDTEVNGMAVSITLAEEV